MTTKYVIIIIDDGGDLTDELVKEKNTAVLVRSLSLNIKTLPVLKLVAADKSKTYFCTFQCCRE